MSFTPNTVEALDDFISAALGRVNTMIPGRVTSYDKATQQAEVLPLIRREVETEDGMVPLEMPVIPGVPVLFMGAGAYKITFPVAAGDIVLLCFAQTSLDNWLQLGGVVDPQDSRKFDLSDAIAIPGLLSFNQATSQVADGALVIAAPEVRIGSSAATEFVALQSEVKAIRDDLEGHTHSYTPALHPAGAGTGTTGSHTGIPNPSGSSKVKVV